MESIRDRIPTFIGILVFITLCSLAYYFLFENSNYYYTKIDNNKVEEINSSDNMKYQYQLIMYNENGKSKEIKFKTSRVLKEGAYLEVKYYQISGVNSWKEVKYEDLPSKVQSKYK